MNAKAFLDTNILLYSYSGDTRKQEISSGIYEQYCCYTSVQALNEFCNVCIKKWRLEQAAIEQSLYEIMDACKIGAVSVNTLFEALDLQRKYGYSFYDCLMLASALEYGCERFISEDLSSGQIIENSLEIINPYK